MVQLLMFLLFQDSLEKNVPRKYKEGKRSSSRCFWDYTFNYPFHQFRSICHYFSSFTLAFCRPGEFSSFSNKPGAIHKWMTWMTWQAFQGRGHGHDGHDGHGFMLQINEWKISEGEGAGQALNLQALEARGPSRFIWGVFFDSSDSNDSIEKVFLLVSIIQSKIQQLAHLLGKATLWAFPFQYNIVSFKNISVISRRLKRAKVGHGAPIAKSKYESRLTLSCLA